MRESGFDARGQAKKGGQFAVLLDALIGRKLAGLVSGLWGWIFDKLAAQGNRESVGIDDLGFKHGVKERVAGGVAVVEAMGAVALVEAQESGAIDGEHELPVESAGIEHLVADEAAHTLGAQVIEGRTADVGEEMVEGFVDRKALLRGVGQGVDVGKDLAFGVTQMEVELPTASQFAAKEQESPPEQKLPVVDDERLEAGVGQLLEPAIEGGPEMAHGADEDPPQFYDLPARRRRAVVWVAIWARASREMWASLDLMRLCSWIHCRTSGSSSAGT